MNNYNKYVVFNNSSEKKENKKELSDKIVRDINEQSTPKEMSQFVSQKLVESIEEDFKSKNVSIVA